MGRSPEGRGSPLSHSGAANDSAGGHAAGTGPSLGSGWRGCGDFGPKSNVPVSSGVRISGCFADAGRARRTWAARSRRRCHMGGEPDHSKCRAKFPAAPGGPTAGRLPPHAPRGPHIAALPRPSSRACAFDMRCELGTPQAGPRPAVWPRPSTIAGLHRHSARSTSTSSIRSPWASMVATMFAS